MLRTTVDFGIDLGTTNSAIAVMNGGEPEVIRDQEGYEITPSAFYVNEKKRVFVGRRAKERLVDQKENAFSEFKLKMGGTHNYTVDHFGRDMKPEELSSWVLKWLREIAKKRLNEEVSAAVVTVPAAFEIPQIEATKEAAKMAGLDPDYSPTLLEPVAAALAYGVKSDSDNVFWLVFDFGGGTFDAAVMQMRDGLFRIVNHAGDNNLGGKLIDWDIVNKIMIPEVLRAHNLQDFHIGNDKWRPTFAKLKKHAEEAKIRLSMETEVDVFIDRLFDDDSGRPVDFELEITRSDIEPLIVSKAERAIRIAKRALSEKNLGPADVEKVLMVGGPTSIPVMREIVRERMGIAIDTTLDPLTVVAKGAAIYSSTIRRDVSLAYNPTPDQVVLRLEYDPTGQDNEPTVIGKVAAKDGISLTGATIEFVNETMKPQWRSGRVPIDEDDQSFEIDLFAEEGSPNNFRIEFFSRTGEQLETVPDAISYTVTSWEVEDPIIINSVGVALANGTMFPFFNRGQTLPQRRKDKRKTAISIRRGDTQSILTIPIMEGEYFRRADRNQRIGDLVIEAQTMDRDLPAGSDVEITIDIDRSRTLKVEAYVPILDRHFEMVFDRQKYQEDAKNPENLRAAFQKQKQRMDELRQKAFVSGDPKVQDILRDIDEAKYVEEVQEGLDALKYDAGAGERSHNRLLELTAAIDRLEDALAWPELVREAEKELEETRQIVNAQGSLEHRSRFQTLENDFRKAVESRNENLLHGKNDEFSELKSFVLLSKDENWVGFLAAFEQMRHSMTDPALADRYIQQGKQAHQAGDINGVKIAVQNLARLLPPEMQKQFKHTEGSVAGDII